MESAKQIDKLNPDDIVCMIRVAKEFKAESQRKVPTVDGFIQWLESQLEVLELSR